MQQRNTIGSGVERDSVDALPPPPIPQAILGDHATIPGRAPSPSSHAGAAWGPKPSFSDQVTNEKWANTYRPGHRHVKLIQLPDQQAELDAILAKERPSGHPECPSVMILKIKPMRHQGSVAIYIEYQDVEYMQILPDPTSVQQ